MTNPAERFGTDSHDSCSDAGSWHPAQPCLSYNAGLFAGHKLSCPHQWQPIETAPKDGTELLLFDRGYVYVGRWRSRGIWASSEHGGMLEPSFWMPLPPLPEEGEAK